MDGPTAGTGRLGGALQFDGRRSRVDVPNSPSLTIQGPLTLTAWVSPLPGKEGTAPAMVEKWDQVREGGISGYFLRVSKAGHAHFMVGSPAGTGEVFSVRPIPTEGWTHLAGVYDKSSEKIYLNGTLEKTTATSAIPGTSRGLLEIGMAGGGGARHFLGSIDDVRLYNRALSPEEVARLAGQ